MRGALLPGLLALAVGGCGLSAPSVDELIARDIASFGADYGISGLHEIKRSTIGADTFALLAGTTPEGRQSVGLLGYRPDGTGFISTWDEAEPGETVSLAEDREGVGDGTRATAWTVRAYGLISEPRVVLVRVSTQDMVTEIEVQAPGYVFEVPATEGGIIRADFVDAAGAVVASFPINR